MGKCPTKLSSPFSSVSYYYSCILAKQHSEFEALEGTHRADREARVDSPDQVAPRPGEELVAIQHDRP